MIAAGVVGLSWRGKSPNSTIISNINKQSNKPLNLTSNPLKHSYEREKTN
jgi:hypothetical protein